MAKSGCENQCSKYIVTLISALILFTSSAIFSHAAFADTVLTTVPTGGIDAAVNPVTNKVYVANSDHLDVIDGSTDTVINTISVSAENVAVNPDTNKIYTTDYNVFAPSTVGVSVIDGNTNTVETTVLVGPYPYAVTVNPVTNRVYVGDSSNGTIYVIDGATNNIITKISAGGEVYGIATNTVTDKIYAVCDCPSGSLVVIDGVTNTIDAKIILSTNLPAHDVAVDPNTNTVYVTTRYGVSVVNGTSNTISGEISPGCDTPFRTNLDPTTNKVYVGCINEHVVAVISGATNTLTEMIQVGNTPGGIGINQDTNKIYVPTGDSIAVISSSTSDTVPSPPQNLDAKTISSSEIDLSWTAPASDGGDVITGYMIERSTDSGSTWSIVSSNTGSTATTFSDAGLVASTIYTYRVSAINTIGTSNPSNTATATTNFNPVVMTSLLTVNSQDSYGNVLEGYYTELYANNGTELDAGYTPYNFTLDGEQSYVIHVENYGNFKFNHWKDTGSTSANRTMSITSDDSITAVYATIPTHPTNLTATAVSSSQINLSWHAPTSDGGSPITAYRIQSSSDGSSWTTIVKNSGNTNTTYSNTGLHQNTTHYYRVFALNSVGSSYRSNVASATTPLLGAAGISMSLK